MNRRLVLFKTISILMLLALGFGAPGGMHLLVAQAGPQTTPPGGLSTSDWTQINTLLRASIPAQQAYLKASNTDIYDGFGNAIAIDGDTVVVGVYTESSNATGIDGDGTNNFAASSGAAYVFIRSGTTWSHQAYLKASNTDAGDWFGMTVAVSGDTIVVGAPSEDSNATGVGGDQADDTAGNSGAAYVFTRSGTTWTQQAYLKASNTDTNDGFGMVAIDGDTIVVGANNESSNATGVGGDQADDSAGNSGAAYVFTRSGTTWTQQAYLKASNTGAGDWFGRTVAVSGNTVVIGAGYEDSSATGVDGNQGNDSAADSGAAYVFTRSGTTWTQQAYLKASNTEAEDDFGRVSISGDTLVVGANLEDSSATGVGGSQSDNGAANSGAAYVFTRSGTTWTQQAYLKASNTGSSDYFGSMLGVSGNTVVIAAPNEDSNATGVNGDGNNDSSSESGAAYVFTRDGTTWSQVAFVKALNTGTMDWFGRSVAVSRDTVVVGADGEDSGATGVGGDQMDNSVANSGAAYVFLSPNNPPTDISLSNASVAENQSLGTTVGTLAALDPDFWNTQTYSLSCSVPGADDTSFHVTGSALQTLEVFDYETKTAYNICIHTDDGKGATYDKNFAISVTNVNEAPTDIVLSNAVVSENQPVGTSVGTLTTSDPDAGQVHTYTLTCTVAGADDLSFLVSGSDLQTNAIFDYETKAAYNICIRTDDGNGGTYDENFSISVTNVNDLPTDISLSNAAVSENQSVGTSVGTLTTTDSDAGQVHTYALNCAVAGADDASFQVTGSALQTNAVFDYETKNTYNICIRTDDGNGGTYDENFSISVTNVVEIIRTVFRSIASQDGWLLERGETTNLGGSLDRVSTTLRLGDDAAKKQYRSLLSFATGAALPDPAVITKVTLRVKRAGIVGGGNPVPAFQGFMLDLRRGFFGTSTLLLVSDWQAIGQKTLGPLNTPISGGWYVFNLTSARTYINKLLTGSGLTQIRLRFQLDDNNDTLANYLSLYSGNAGAAARPQLIVEYYIP